MKISDFEIHNTNKLDKVLVKLCSLVIKNQKKNPDKFGMVAACVIDNDNNMVFRTSKRKAGKWSHAERNAMDAYESKYGDIPAGSIIVTTLTPCNETMNDRYGSSCTDIINNSKVRKVYCGYADPTQDDHKNKFNEQVTENKKIIDLCKMFADTFLRLDESWSKKYKRSINCNAPKGFSQRAHCQGRKKNENFADGKNPGRKGLAKRSGVNCKQSVTKLRSIAKNSSGERQRMAHWCANMKSGKKK
jgi:pyrimidine deaminase RibD-like protein